MKKSFELEDLDCAVCAQKMEDAIRKIDGVIDVSVSYIMQKLVLEASDDKFDEIIKKVIKVCKKVEPDCRIKVK